MTKQELEFREGNILKLLIRFSIPSTIAALIAIIYNITDRYFIGQVVGRHGISAMVILFPLLLLFNSCGMLFGTGGGALASIYLGKKDTASARKVLGTSIFTVIVIGAFFTLITISFSEKIGILLGASENNLSYFLEYTKYFFPSIIFQVLVLSIVPFIRSDGKPFISLVISLSSALTNILLDYILVIKLGQGMKGAAIATSISNIIPCVLMGIYFLYKTDLLKLETKYLNFDLKLIKEIANIGSSGFFNQILNSAFGFILNVQLINYGGDIPLAGMGIMTVVRSFINTSFIGLNQGRLPIISYNWGAKRYSRVIHTFLYSVGVTLTLSLILVFFIRNFSYEIGSFFVKNDAPLVEYIGNSIPIHLGFMVSTALYLSCANYFQAVGKGSISAKLTILRLGILTIPLTILLPMKFGVFGILIAFPISDCIAALVAIVSVSKEILRIKKLPSEF